MKKVEEFFGTRSVKTALLFCVVVSMMVVMAFAEDTTTGGASIDVSGITTAFTNGFNSMVTTSISMISAMVPIALTLCGVLFLVKKAMSWFKSMAK